MQFSQFGKKFTKKSGILQLMDDLGSALASNKPVNMLGGGNPARIDAVNQAYQHALERIVASGAGVESVGNYSTPQGDTAFIRTLVDFFNHEYGWGLTEANIALTNGSQNAFFYYHLRQNTLVMPTHMYTVLILCLYLPKRTTYNTMEKRVFSNIMWILTH